MSPKKTVHIFGGGTISYVRNHLALCAPAWGHTARELKTICEEMMPEMDIHLHLTKMAKGGEPGLITNKHIQEALQNLTLSNTTKIIFMSAALVDFTGQIDDVKSGKYADRLISDNPVQMTLTPAEKIIKSVRKDRKDIFLVGFKTTCGFAEDQQYVSGLKLCKQASCNLVLANDVETRTNMIITPEEARYHVSTNRTYVLRNLVEMAKLRSHLSFTRSTVVDGQPIPWNSELVPDTLRKVVNYCIARGAYKPFNGVTVGHFACKLNDNTFLTSIRRTNFNEIEKNGLVKIVTDGPDTVLAYGAKPSVGGQSQRIVFENHKEYDCIVHFHSPIKKGSLVPQVSQREAECGSHFCGERTSRGLQKFGGLKAVYLQEHGPNIVFHHSIDPQEVINFIEANFDLEKKTGGFVEVSFSHDDFPSTVDDAKKLLS